MIGHARVAIIGGGVVGTSVLYHLTKRGWRDVVLIERAELTAGSTWHAAGGMHTINSDPNVAKLQRYTIDLYNEIEAVSGQSCGAHLTGGIMLADSPDRLDYLKVVAARGKYLGMDTEFLSPREAAERLPIIDPSHFVGALYDPNEGHVDPSGVTQAYAQAARLGGATIYRHNRVLELNAVADGWQVVTEQGTLHAEHVVNAAGLWAREVGAMAGVNVPLVPMEHQYLVTDDVAEVADLPNGFHAVDPGGGLYLRSEIRGVLLGTYESNAATWSELNTPWDFPQELLPSDLDRIESILTRAFERFPPLGRAGIKRVVNGPFTFTPDGNPLVGPVRGLTNFWSACGVLAGFSQGGGIGLVLSNWMVDGDPGVDTWAMDVSRFGDYATPQYAREKGREVYSTRFMIAFPNEERPAGRPLRRTALYDRLRGQGAVFGASYGLEHALWYDRGRTGSIETPSYRRSNAFAAVAEECDAVRNRVGLLEIASYARYRVAGAQAEAWLDQLLANKLPGEGRIRLTPMLNPRGRIVGDFTVARLAGDEFLLFGSGPAQAYHMRWFESHLPGSGVELQSLRTSMTGLAIAGPRAREVLSRCAQMNVDAARLPFMSFAAMPVGHVLCQVGRISYTGELGYEIWCAPDQVLTLYETLLEAGEPSGLRLFGSRALNSLRLEKGFASFNRDLTADYSALEADLARFVADNKGAFIGRDALREERSAGSRMHRSLLRIEAVDADTSGNEPIFHAGEVVGWVTSGGYGHTIGQSLAMGYIKAEFQEATEFEVEILGVHCPARRLDAPPVDPAGVRMRS